MKTVNMHEAKTHLSRLIEEAVAGDDFIVARAGKPMVRVSRIDARPVRRLGFLAGEKTVPEDFDDLASPEIAALFSRAGMNLLLDTHVLLWAAFLPDQLSKASRERLLDTENMLWFSAVSIWEVAIKRSLGRPDFTVDPGPLRTGLLQNGYAELVLEGRHCLGLATLPDHHSDPFDRILVVQAAAEGMVLLTADHKVARYGGPVELI